MLAVRAAGLAGLVNYGWQDIYETNLGPYLRSGPFGVQSRAAGMVSETDSAIALAGLQIHYTAQSRARVGRLVDAAFAGRVGPEKEFPAHPRLGRAVLLGGSPRIGTDAQ